MGREIRRVPLDWVHPKNDRGFDQPLFDRDYETERDEWLDGLASWQDGSHKDLGDDPKFREKYDYWEWVGNPPDREYYRPKWETEPAGYQIYETVSEGTPVSPVFANQEDIKIWLMKQGYSEKASQQFIEDAWAISFVYTPKTGLVDGIAASEFDR